MKKKIILSFLWLIFNNSPSMFSQNLTDSSSKHVIGGRTFVGFFSNFLAVLNQLQWCQKNNKVPVVYWPKPGLYYDERGLNGIISDNIWDYYFYPVSDLCYESPDQPYFEYSLDGYAVATLPYPFPYEEYAHIKQIYPDKELRSNMNNLISNYIKIKEPTLNKIEKFYQKHLKDTFTVSIHLRGTDKYHEIQPIALDRIFEEANKYAPCQFYIATDEEKLLEEAQKKLRGNVVSYDCFRSSNNNKEGVHYLSDYPADRSRALLGEEALIDCILLSRCNLMIHTSSNLSISALLFNPDIDHIHIDKVRSF